MSRQSAGGGGSCRQQAADRPTSRTRPPSIAVAAAIPLEAPAARRDRVFGVDRVFGLDHRDRVVCGGVA
jgi:hypothetical protein